MFEAGKLDAKRISHTASRRGSAPSLVGSRSTFMLLDQLTRIDKSLLDATSPTNPRFDMHFEGPSRPSEIDPIGGTSLAPRAFNPSFKTMVTRVSVAGILGNCINWLVYFDQFPRKLPIP